MSILIFLVLKAITFLPESFRNECILQFVDVLPTAKAGVEDVNFSSNNLRMVLAVCTRQLPTT